MTARAASRPSTGQRFDAAFDKAARNITEVGEPEVIESIRQGSRRLLSLLRRVLRTAIRRPDRQVFQRPRAAFNTVRADCDRLLRLNQEAMRRKADAASATARQMVLHHAGAGHRPDGRRHRRRVQPVERHSGPVRQLTEATTRVAGGDLDAAVPVRSNDEIGALASGFNRMAERIRELRRSDLGQLLVAQQTTEAAIDSLYDPVIVTDSEGRVTRVNAAAERLFGPRAEVRRQADRRRSRAKRASSQAVTDVLRSEAGRGVGERRRSAAVGRRRRPAGVPHPLDADARRRRSPGRRGDAARGHHASQRDQPAEVRVHRRRVARTADAADERPDGHPSAARRRRRAARPSGSRRFSQVCRDDTARLDRLMRELLDLSKIESGDLAPEPVSRASVGYRTRSGRVGASAGGGPRPATEHRRAARFARCLRRPRPDRAGHRQPGDECVARDAVGRQHHRGRGTPRRQTSRSR